jgi:hypothetical protein
MARSPSVFQIDPKTADNLDDMRRQLNMDDNAEVVLRAIEFMRVALTHSKGGVVTILTPDGKTLPVRLAGT